MVFFEFHILKLKVLARHSDDTEIKIAEVFFILYIPSFIITSKLSSYTFINDTGAFFIVIFLIEAVYS